MTSLYRIQEGSFALPETFLDRTVNIFVPSGNERATPSLNISRDTLRPNENLTTYIDRQIALMKKTWASTGYFRGERHWRELAKLP
nr:DcrB-related protein [Escherichia sp. E2661]